MKIYVINGPNLHLLGCREISIYGTLTLDNIKSSLIDFSTQFNGVEIIFCQSNSEGGLIDIVSKAYYSRASGIIINPAAYTHTSIALYDALKAVEIPTVEVHISNIYKREKFRHNSITAPACIGQIAGFGANGYKYALTALLDYLNLKK